jgi:pSer/pThr/pTyr-binding forkhead associated (FHA) protein
VFRLEVAHANGTRAVIEVPGDRALIGRAAECDVCTTDDPHSSRHHARIAAMEGGGWFVEDLGSENGTAVNDRALDRNEALVQPEPWRRTRILVAGDIVRCGQTRVRFRI